MNTSPDKIHLVHVITGLGTGGAEGMLLRLLSFLDRDRFEPAVVSLGEDGPTGVEIRAAGVPLDILGMKPGKLEVGAVVRLASLFRKRSADLVQTWMYHADLVGGLAARWAGGIPTIWGIRNTHLDFSTMKRSTVLTAQVCALLSRWLPERIVCCSFASCTEHQRMGYDRSRSVVIPNGFDLERFRPNPQARQEVRSELGFPTSAKLVGLAARFHPIKDHQNFLRAARILVQWMPEVRFVLCGDGIDPGNRQLASWMMEEDLAGKAYLLGRRTDMPRLLASLDVVVSSSRGEAFPNVVGEAMACGVPCAVTDVGDSSLIVDKTGVVVPPAEPEALARAMEKLLQLPMEKRVQLGLAARKRIQEQFHLPDIAARYARLYEEIALNTANLEQTQRNEGKPG